MSTTKHPEHGTQANWLPVYAALTSIALVIVDRFDILPGMRWWWLTLAAVVATGLSVLFTLIQSNVRGNVGWLRVIAHRATTMIGAGVWATWTDLVGWTSGLILWGGVGVVALSALGLVCQSPAQEGRMPAVEHHADPVRDISPRTPKGTTYQQALRAVTKLKDITVTDWEHWAVKGDGLRLFVELPADQGTTLTDLAQKTDALAHACRLPDGCAIRVLKSHTQGIVVVDVMLRNTLGEGTAVHTEPATPASINDDFPILRTPRGEMLSICLRIFSMIVGGTTGSGKTTLLHRIVMWLARCTDAVVWVVDLNGGGVADPWISPWAEGRASHPVVDWVATSEEEAAVMVAVARAIAVDRKANPAAKRRKRDANATVLPVSPDMPALVVLTDEGGEVRQAASLFGQLTGQGISRLAQIGRAEGVRTIMSVLRGTADLLDKGLRTVTALRLCLRMEEHDEYVHVLGSNPGKTDLEGAVGAGFLRTDTITRPVLGRTVNVDLAGIDRHAVVTAELRPALDQYALAAAARVTPQDVLGRPPAREYMVHPAMRDAELGRAYSGRWDRYRAKMLEEYGIEVEGVDATPAAPQLQRPAPASGANPVTYAAATAAPASTRTATLDAWGQQVLGGKDAAAAPPAPTPVAQLEGSAKVIPLFGGRPQQEAPTPAAPAAGPTAREQILALVRAAGATGIAASEVERQVNAARSRVMDLLKELREQAKIEKNGGGLYVMAKTDAQNTAG